MTIKKLQNNFTTPEQSKRLLELGVPSDSADCYYSYEDSPLPKWTINGNISNLNMGVIPCWSVGRLMEIACKCWNGDRRAILFPNIGIHNNNIMEYVFHFIECDIPLGCLDFSKLED